jgi:ABC-2 type transport system ATP-binding protein
MEEQQAENEVVVAKGLRKTFRDFWRRPRVEAVRGIDFRVLPGEVFGLLGPNGSGKSTTIKMILGLLEPTRGLLSVLGKSPHDVKTKERIGYLPEETYLYPHLSCEETIDFFGRLFQLGAAQRTERVEQLLEMVGLAQARRRVVGELSKGMARRIGLAQALINDPDLVVLDEPTSGLDPLGCRQVKDLILQLARRGKTVLLSSHLLADVEDVCDRVAILYNGTIRVQGVMKELLEHGDRYQLSFPELPAEVMQSVLERLRGALGYAPELQHPRRNLEQFFLDVVREAQDGREVYSGARSGELADYLQTREAAPEVESDMPTP